MTAADTQVDGGGSTAGHEGVDPSGGIVALVVSGGLQVQPVVWLGDEHWVDGL